MLRDAAVSLIALRLGNRTDLNDQIIAEMQLVQETLERSPLMPFFLLTEMATAQTVTDIERVALPTDFLQEYEAGALWYYAASGDTLWTPLIKRALEDFKGAELTSGAPQYYAVTGEYFRIAPIADAAYDIKMLYYAQADVLDTNIENGWLKYAAEWIIAETGTRIAAYIQNDKMISVFMQNAQTAKDAFWRYNEERKHSNQDYRMEFN